MTQAPQMKPNLAATDLPALTAQAQSLLANTQSMLGQSLIDMAVPIELVMIAAVAQGHVLLEGVPGTAKTTLCRTLASAIGLDFRRIQFTPDLLPSDVTGTKILDQANSKFVLQPGPIFCQLLLGDELNRAPARTQAALLEAMQENQVTIEGDTLPLPQPFIVLATQNPVEQEGVYRLPEAQLDRFLFRVNVGYPQRSSEIDLLDLQERTPPKMQQICDAKTILALQQAVPMVHATPEIKAYVVDLIRATREHREVLLGASPRAGIYLLRAARSRALFAGRNFVSHEDVQAMAGPVLEHRVIMRPEAELSGHSTGDLVLDVVRSVAIRGA